MDDSMNSCLIVLEHDINIAKGLLYMIHCVDEIAFLLTREMSSLQKDIKYWKNISNLDPLHALISKYYVSLFRHRFNFTHYSYNTYNIEENTDHNIILLRFHLDHLSMNMARISDITTELKTIIIKIDNLNPISIINNRVIISDDVIEECLSLARYHLINSKCIRHALMPTIHMYSCIQAFLTQYTILYCTYTILIPYYTYTIQYI